MNKLQKFGSMKECLKCGSSQFDIEWQEEFDYNLFLKNHTSYGVHVIRDEQMLITCETCGYFWRERPKDAD